MNITQKRTSAFIAGVAIVCTAAWLLGYDYDRRGGDAFFIFLTALTVGMFGSAYPFKEKRND